MPAAQESDKVGEDAQLVKKVNQLCFMTMLMMSAVTMCVPTRAPMVLAIKKGDTAQTARAMGLMSTCAAIIELVINPILGKLSDEYGRKPFLMLAPAINAFLHSLVAVLPMSLPMQFVDRMISGSMIFGFAGPCRAAVADLFPGSDDATQNNLAKWYGIMGMYLGVGTTIGPLIGSKLGGARSFFVSALTFLATTVYVQTNFNETLVDSKKKKFQPSDINPAAFVKMFKDRTLSLLAATSALSSFGDYVNIYDINNLFMIKTLGFQTSQIGTFAMTVGVTQILGGLSSKEIVSRVGKKSALLFAQLMWAIGMTAMGTARSARAAFFALFLWTFGHSRESTLAPYIKTEGQKAGMGNAETIAANMNLLAYIKVAIPLFYSNLFAWATSNGRNIPGLPYFVISALTLLSQGTFLAANV